MIKTLTIEEMRTRAYTHRHQANDAIHDRAIAAHLQMAQAFDKMIEGAGGRVSAGAGR